MARSRRNPSSSPELPLVCPSCGRRWPRGERFCGVCSLPLVYPPDQGGLVKVAWARNQAEAELIEGLLREEGIPSIARRQLGFDVPDFLAAGPRDIFVPASGVEAARELLGESDAPPPPPSAPPRPALVIALVLLGALIASGLAWALLQSAGY
jgi:hypothetical protein